MPIPKRVSSRIAASALGLSALLALPAGTARAEDDLQRELSEVGKQVKLLLDQKGKDSIAVGDFRGPARLASSSGPSITKALGESLKGMGVTVKRTAELEVNGEYRDVEDRSSHKISVEIKARVVDRSGNEVVAFEPRGVFSMSLIAALTGVTVSLPADATEKERDKKLGEALDSPNVHVDKATTRISAKADSLYAIEILVKSGSDYLPRAASKDSDGFAFVKVRRDETYAVKLINDSPHDAAVTLTIDGLSCFAFSSNKAYTHWIVGSKQSLTVPGWHRTNDSSDTFVVTEYAKSAVSEALPSSSAVGTITASFAAAWPKGGNPPEDEASSQKGARSGDATGKGPPIKTGFVEVEREVGRLRDAVSVRYTKDDAPLNLPASASKP